jgi:hypothetical protein
MRASGWYWVAGFLRSLNKRPVACGKSLKRISLVVVGQESAGAPRTGPPTDEAAQGKQRQRRPSKSSAQRVSRGKRKACKVNVGLASKGSARHAKETIVLDLASKERKATKGSARPATAGKGKQRQRKTSKCKRSVRSDSRRKR